MCLVGVGCSCEEWIWARHNRLMIWCQRVCMCSAHNVIYTYEGLMDDRNWRYTFDGRDFMALMHAWQCSYNTNFTNKPMNWSIHQIFIEIYSAAVRRIHFLYIYTYNRMCIHRTFNHTAYAQSSDTPNCLWVTWHKSMIRIELSQIIVIYWIGNSTEIGDVREAISMKLNDRDMWTYRFSVIFYDNDICMWHQASGTVGYSETIHFELIIHNNHSNDRRVFLILWFFFLSIIVTLRKIKLNCECLTGNPNNMIWFLSFCTFRLLYIVACRNTFRVCQTPT